MDIENRLVVVKGWGGDGREGWTRKLGLADTNWYI